MEKRISGMGMKRGGRAGDLIVVFNVWVSSIYDLVIKSKQKYLSQIENVNQYITVIRQFLKAMNISYIYKSSVVRGQRHPELILT